MRALMTSARADEFVDRVATLQRSPATRTRSSAAAAANVAAAQAQATGPEGHRRAGAVRRGLRPAGRPAVADRRVPGGVRAAQCPGAGGGGRGHERGRDRASRATAWSRAVQRTRRRQQPAAQIAVDTAMAQRGKPYVWAASGPGSFDCSGLVQYAYAAAGIGLPHSSRLQAGWGSRSRGTSFSPVTWSPSTARSATWASTSATARWCTRPQRATSSRSPDRPHRRHRGDDAHRWLTHTPCHVAGVEQALADPGLRRGAGRPGRAGLVGVRPGRVDGHEGAAGHRDAARRRRPVGGVRRAAGARCGSPSWPWW